jgi:hypothetical protein
MKREAKVIGLPSGRYPKRRIMTHPTFTPGQKVKTIYGLRVRRRPAPGLCLITSAKIGASVYSGQTCIGPLLGRGKLVRSVRH